MKKFLRFSLVALFAVLGMSNAMAQEVTLDFTTNSWGFPAGSKNKTVDEQSFTYDGYTVKVAGSTGQGYYWHDSDHYLLFGKQGAYVTLPAFSFDVERIDIEIPGGASKKVTQNIFVGDNAVSTETTGNGTKNFLIASDKQAAGTVYTIKVTNANNSQIKKILIWKKGTSGDQKLQAGIAWSKATATVTYGNADDTYKYLPTFQNPNNLTGITFSSDNSDAVSISTDGEIEVEGVGEATLTASFAGNDQYEAAEVTCKVTVNEAVSGKTDISNTEETAYTIAKAIELIDDANSDLTKEVYVKGIISQIDKFNDDKTITYWISDDGTTTNQFECYHGKGIGGADFAATTDLKVGATVIAKGKMTKYNTTYEFGSGNVLVSYDESTAGEQVDISNTPETAYTVAKAYELIDAGKGLETEVYVKGIISKIDKFDDTNKYITYWISDDGSATNQFECYKGKGLNGADFTALTDLKLGATVIVKGKMKKYNTTYEFDAGNVLISYDESTAGGNPEDAIEGGTTPETALTVAQALAYIEDFPAAGFITEKQYYVSGTVSEVTEINTTNGNATFKMGNLVVFRVKGLENKNISDENYLKANDEVIVLAKLQKYVKESVATLELSSGYIYSLNGETEEQVDPYTFVGDGTETNPYTVEDVLHMAVPSNTSAADGQERVWVKGIIAGAINSNNHNAIETTTEINNNLALAATAGETVFNNTVPVQLSTNALKDELGIANNPSHVSKELVVYGFIVKYFNVTGVKGVTDYILDGVPSNISALTIDTDVNAPMYNLKGERVDANYRGVVIKGGKKTIQK